MSRQIDRSQLPPALAWCVSEGLLASGSEHYRVHRAAHVVAHHLDWLTFVATRFAAATADTPWLIEIPDENGNTHVICPNVVILRPSVLTETRYDDDYKGFDPGDAWDRMCEAVIHAQRHGQIVMLDLDDHPYAWNEYHPENRITPEQWVAHDRYVAQFNAVLCSTKYLVKVMEERFAHNGIPTTHRGIVGFPRFEYAPNLYDPWRYEPGKASFGNLVGSHIFVKARDGADFARLTDELWPAIEDLEVNVLHIGEEFPCAICSHPEHHHFEAGPCDDCACEEFRPAEHSALSGVTGIPEERIDCLPACNPSELPMHIPNYNVGVVPLADSVWNYAKTEGKGFEMAAAGVPFVALTGEHPLYARTPGFPSDRYRIRKLLTDPTYWGTESNRARRWAEKIAAEHQIEYLATMKRLANSDLRKVTP